MIRLIVGLVLVAIALRIVISVLYPPRRGHQPKSNLAPPMHAPRQGGVAFYWTQPAIRDGGRRVSLRARQLDDGSRQVLMYERAGSPRWEPLIYGNGGGWIDDHPEAKRMHP